MTSTLASPSPSDLAPRRRETWVAVVVPIAVVAVTALISLGRIVWTPGFYYADDTQLGATGIWYEIGDNLLNGTVRQFNPQGWQAGNYWAEGQWGLINPMIWLIGLGVRLSADVAIAASIIKVFFLAVMASGVYALARSYGAARSWAALAAVLVPQAGFTAYMDAPSWVTGLMTTALFPWAWVALRRVTAGRSPALFLLVSYLLVTIGYVFGTMLLAFLLLESLIAALVRRDGRVALRLVAASLWAGLWAIVVYLPGVLTAPVTERGTTEIQNFLFLNADLSDLSSTAMPIATSTIGAWWGSATAGPLVYIAWVLPLVVLVRPWSRELWRGTRSLVVVALAMLVLVLGPSDIGPIRWPVRFMPYLAIAVVVLFAILLTRGFPQRVSRNSVVAAAVTTLATAWLSWAQTPAITRSVAVIVGIQLSAIAAMWLSARAIRRHSRGDDAGRESTFVRRAVAGLVAAFIVVTAGISGYQMRAFPTTPLPTFAAPTSAADMSSVLADADGDVMTVGDALSNAFSAETFDETLVANLWYFSPAEVSNLYTVLPFTTYSDDLCVDLRGGTCDTAWDTLVSIDADTGVRVADLLSVSEIVGYRSTFPQVPGALPEGWRTQSEGERTWRIVRDRPVPTAGGVTWAGEGTEVTELARDDTSVTLRVDRAGSDPRVVLSRLAWPGYRVDGAAMTDPVRGYLLTVDLADAEQGSVVTVSFAPPGSVALIGSSVAAALVGAAWMVLFVVGRVRRRREDAPSAR